MISLESCGGCNGRDILSEQKQFMETYGWYAHYVPDDKSCPFEMNYHTHGFQESYGHLDMQICLPVSPEICQSIISNLLDLIKKGRKFQESDIVGGIIRDFDITFLKALENDREVLRIILPDQHGNLSKETMTGFYIFQWEL